MTTNNIQSRMSLNDFVDEIIYFDEMDRIVPFSEDMKKALLKRTDKKTDDYQNLLLQYTKLRWAKLNLATESEVKELFQNKFEIALAMPEFDIREKVRCFLIDILDFDERDRIKNDIKEILQKSSAKLTLNNLNNGQPPTVENWLKLYASNVGNGAADKLKLQEFYVHDKNFLALDVVEREKIKRLFEFFEKLKHSSYSPLGIEESVPIIGESYQGFLRDGEIIKIDNKMTNIIRGVQEVVRDYKIGEAVAENKANVFEELNKPQPVAVPQKPAPLIVAPPAFTNVTSGKPVFMDELVEEKSVENKAYGELRPLAHGNENDAKNKQLSELRALATNYPEDSLERRVIEEEILKVEGR